MAWSPAGPTVSIAARVGHPAVRSPLAGIARDLGRQRWMSRRCRWVVCGELTVQWSCRGLGDRRGAGCCRLWPRVGPPAVRSTVGRTVRLSASRVLVRRTLMFRMAKHDLATRPIYHRKRESIEAHLAVVVAAPAVGRLVEDCTGWSIRRFVRTARRWPAPRHRRRPRPLRPTRRAQHDQPARRGALRRGPAATSRRAVPGPSTGSGRGDLPATAGALNAHQESHGRARQGGSG
jgi:hypothetical protein